MRYFRRLSPRASAANIFERVFFLVSIALMELPMVMILLFSSHPSGGAIRLGIIAIDLGILGLGCASALKIYRTRFHQPDRAPYPFSSWQSRLRAIALAAALPICAFILAVIIPPTSRAFEIVFPISLIGGVALLVVCMVVSTSRSPSA